MWNFVMTKSFLFYICRIVTSRTSYISIPSDFCTGRSFRTVSYLAMYKCIYITGFVMVAIVAISTLSSMDGTRRIKNYFPISVRMSCSRNFCIGAVITSWTGYIAIPTDCSTRRSFCFVSCFIVTESCDTTGFVMVAIVAISTFLTTCCTSRCCRG